MKYYFGFILFAIVTAFPLADSFYSLPLRNIDGMAIDLSSFKGKKIMIVVLPIASGDNSITIEDLNAIQSKYENLAIIGIPANETGYRIEDKTQVKSRYSNLNSGFVLAEGMKVSKEAGEAQSPLFAWLTQIEKNGYFNTNVQGSGDKFFVNSEGRLYAVMSGNIRLFNPLIDKILSR
jgi:glutathione peroxidase